MIKLSEILKIVIAAIMCILLGIWIGETYDDKDILSNPTAVPPCPDTSEPMYYKFNEEEWIYLFRNPRAKGENHINKPYLKEEDLQRYLEKKVDGYLEDTYWGEEYDLDGQVPDE